jgi:tight adherence protein C
MDKQAKAMLLILVPLALLAGAATYMIWSAMAAGDKPGRSPAEMAAISVCVLAAVSLTVAAAFAQPGAIRMSAERESALATGHSDRRTVFENLWMRPLLWLLLLLAHRLAMPKAKEWLRRTLVAAGSPNYYTPEEYLALSMLVGVALGTLLSLLNLMFSGEPSVVSFLGGVLIGTGMAIYHMHDRAARRIRLISKRVPYSLDLIALAMGAGATFTEAVKTVVREKTDDPFNVELRAMLAEIELGTVRRKALLNLSDRVPLDSLRSIIASVVQSEDLGTPLGQVLHDQATLLRQQRSVRAENAAAIASVRILIPCLLLVMAVVLTVFGPMIISTRQGGLF